MQAVEVKTSKIEAVKSEGMGVGVEPVGMAVKPEGMAVRTAAEVEMSLAVCTAVRTPVPEVDAAACTAVRTGVAEAEAGEVAVEVEPVEVEPEGHKAEADLVDCIDLAGCADAVVDLLTDSHVAEREHDPVRILLLIDVSHPLVNGVILLP